VQVIKDLVRRMETKAMGLNFEAAAVRRDQIIDPRRIQ
jgi:excinuclease UvrABC nuclease subunit